MTAARARGQANLAALAVALVTLTAVTGLGLALADAALDGADRDPGERRAARVAADRLVAGDAAPTRRQNVLDADAVDDLTAGDLDELAPPVAGLDLRVSLDDRTLLARGDPTGGTTVRRIVLVAEAVERSRTVDLSETDSVTLPRRTARLTLTVRPGDATVTTVRVDDRVVLHDPDGLSGTATVAVSRRRTVTLSVGFDGRPGGELVVTSHPTETTKATLAVTVDG